MDKVVILAIIVIALPIILGIGSDVLKRWMSLRNASSTMPPTWRCDTNVN